jgi:AcrR family transcriptional regulator
MTTQPTSAETPRLSQLERRKLAARSALLGAARELIGANGLRELSVQSITDRADVALGTFYNYFHDKQALFGGLLELDEESHRLKVAERVMPGDDSATVVAGVTAVGFSRSWIHPSFARYTHEMYRAGFFSDERATATAFGRASSSPWPIR